MRDYNIAELDFVLEMAALDTPEQYTFNREGRDGIKAPVAMAQWLDVLQGSLKARYLARIGLASALETTAAWKARQGSGLQPGLSRGGKPLPLPEDR